MMDNALVHRAIIKRPVADLEDDYQSPTDQLEIVGSDVHCFFRERSIKQVVDGRLMEVQVIVGLFRIGADVQMDDRVVSLLDRRGRTVFEEPLFIETVSLSRGMGGRLYKRATVRRAS